MEAGNREEICGYFFLGFLALSSTPVDDRVVARVRGARELLRPGERFGLAGRAARGVWSDDDPVRVSSQRVQLDLCADASALGLAARPVRRQPRWPRERAFVEPGLLRLGGLDWAWEFLCFAFAARRGGSAHFSGQREGRRLLVPGAREEPGDGFLR